MASNFMNIKQKPGISCNLCQRSFSQKSSLTRHISIVHDKLKPHSCSECHQSFSMRDQLKKHMISNHSSSTAVASIVKVKQAVSCKLCNRSFSQRSSLTRHVIIVHKKLKPHSCSECQQSFSMRDQLKKHIISNHPSGDFKLYSCSLCNERFSDFKVLQLHKKQHVIQCSQCLRKFSCSQSLKIHTNVVHTKLYSCETCSKYFPSESLLYRHIQTHKADNADLMSRDEPREYHCELCQTPFIAKMDLDLHILRYHKQVVPNDVKPTNHNAAKVDIPNYTELKYKELDSFSCEICNKHFNSKGSYFTHITKHFNKKLKISISKLSYSSKENIESIARKPYKTKYRVDSKSQKSNKYNENNALKVKDEKVKQVRVNIEKMNIDNIFDVWGISVINQHDDIINQVVSNHSVNTESEINLEVTDKTSNGFNSDLTEEDFKNEKIHSKICISTTDFKVDKEESKLSNALIASFEINRFNKPTEKDIIDEDDISEKKGLSILEKKPELEENHIQDLNDDLEENAKGDIMDAKDLLQLNMVFKTNAFKEEGCDLYNKESEIDIDELLDGDDEDIYNSSNSEVPNILYEELFHDLYSSSQQGEHKKKVVKEVFITTQETEQPKDNLENEGLTDEGLSSSENQPVLLSSQKVCAYCDLIFSNQRSLDQHMQTIHPTEKPHFCDLCNKSFTRQESLHSHNRSVHFERRENSYSEFQISEQYNFGNKTNFYDTIKRRKRSEGKTFAPELNYNCDKCKKDFRCKDSLLNHKKTCSNENEERKKVYLQSQKGIICSVCGKGFPRKCFLKDHMTIHTGEKSYSCFQCGKTFTRKNNMNFHMKTHGSKLEFKCSICGIGFNRNDTLIIHTRTHTGKKTFSCDKCKKVFICNSHMNRHKKICVNINQIEKLGIICSICGKSFTRKDSLKMHMRIHTGEKLYSCDQCKKSFGRKGALSIHSRIHNREEEAKIESLEDQDVKMETNDVNIIECIKEDECLILGSVEKRCSPILEVCNLSKDNPKQKKQKKNGLTSKTILVKKEMTANIFYKTKVESSYSCKICNEIFDAKNQLLKHQISHLKGIKLQDDFAIIKNGASGVNSATSAANELVHKCPMDSCGTKMGVYDLKNGRAVQHMIESHQIYPYRMVKLGLSWIKTFF